MKAVMVLGSATLITAVLSMIDMSVACWKRKKLADKKRENRKETYRKWIETGKRK